MGNILGILFGALIAAAPLAASADAPQTVTLEVKNMSCAACPITVKKALTKVPGVETARVDLDSATAVVTFDPSRATVEAITKATTNAGFPSALKR